MASWAAKRKAVYLGGFLAVLFFLVALPTFLFFYKAPSCNDGKRNQGELGIDCGGPCLNLCVDRNLPPIIDWQRLFRTAPGFYSVLAYVENPNLASGVLSAPYIFRLYDGNGVAIAERNGIASIPPGAIVPIFEPLLATGERAAVRSSFAFLGNLNWSGVSGSSAPAFKILRQELVNDTGLPRLDATLKNESEEKISKFKVIAIVYGFDGNAVDVSQTVVEGLLPGDSVELSFTWRAPLSESAAKVEIVPILYPGINY